MSFCDRSYPEENKYDHIPSALASPTGVFSPRCSSPHSQLRAPGEAKKLTAPGIPRRSPIQAVTRPNLWLLWWHCEDMKLRATLLSNWQGSCTMTQRLMPFHLFPVGDFKALGDKLSPEKLGCLKRSTVPGGSFDNRVYLDSIGVLRSPR